VILRYSGRFHKVINVRSYGDNNWTFETKNLDAKKNRTLMLNLSVFLEALDRDFPLADVNARVGKFFSQQLNSEDSNRLGALFFPEFPNPVEKINSFCVLLSPFK
jgi:hypothetical protein